MSGSVAVIPIIELSLERLADELARRLYTPSEIAEKFSTDLPTIWELLQRPTFANMVKERKLRWLSSANTENRMRVMSQVAYIELLPSLFGLAADARVAAPARIDAAKLIQKAAEPPQADRNAPGAGRAVQVNILFQNHPPMNITTVGTPVLEHEYE